MITIDNQQCCDIRQKAHPNCVACSLLNTKGLQLAFAVNDDGVHARFECDEAFEGYPGMLHGGIISTILDGAMGNCLFALGLIAVTVEITTRFRHPVLIGRAASVQARLERIAEPLYLLTARIVQDGQVKATAKGKFFHQPRLNSDGEQNDE